jgi:Flp pilus assembly protein TadD
VALANLFMKRDAPRAAVDLLVDILSVYPSDLDALFALGRALIRDERVDEALQVLHRLVAHDDKNVEALFFMGVGLARRRHFAQAVAAWERVIALEPTSSVAQRARRHMRSATDLRRVFSDEAA